MIQITEFVRDGHPIGLTIDINDKCWSVAFDALHEGIWKGTFVLNEHNGQTGQLIYAYDETEPTPTGHVPVDLTKSSSGLAALFLKERLEAGETIVIPSLGIAINEKNLDASKDAN